MDVRCADVDSSRSCSTLTSASDSSTSSNMAEDVQGQEDGETGTRRVRPCLLDGEPLTATVQWYAPPRRRYTRRELLADRAVNFSGAGLSWLGTCALVYASLAAGDSVPKTLGYLVHGIGLIMMLNGSAFYHYLCWDWERSEKLYSVDKMGINAMIIGCYTPVCLQCGAVWTLIFVCLLGSIGLAVEAWYLCGWKYVESAGWSWAEKLNLARYVLMGWAIVFVAPAVVKFFPAPAIYMVLSGGIIYTSGIVFFLLAWMEFHLAIWHSFVLCASLCFFLVNALFLVGRHELQ